MYQTLYHNIYLEINLLSVVILLHILHCIRLNMDKQVSQLAFVLVARTLLALLMLDSLWAMMDGMPGQGMRMVNMAANAAYLFLSGAIGFCWYNYTRRKLDMGVMTKRLRILILLPLGFLLALILASPWTGWLFYMDAGNVYHRGAYHFIQPLITYIYLLLSAIHVYRYIQGETVRRRRIEALELLSFILLPAIGSVINLLTEGLPTVWPMATLSLMMVFYNMQSYKISTDGLTGLNNRRQFDLQIQRSVEDVHRMKHLVLLLMDVNRFKSINDQYGHSEGDRALKITADELKLICDDFDVFLARYGGDEFVICGGFRSMESARLLEQRIRRVFDQLNRQRMRPYDLTLSIGMVEFGVDGLDTTEKLIAGADKALYEEKARRR